jgi:hypothetical protein
MNVGNLRRKMVAWFGETFYWMATVIAGLLLAWVVWSYAFNGSKRGAYYPDYPLAALRDYLADRLGLPQGA